MVAFNQSAEASVTLQRKLACGFQVQFVIMLLWHAIDDKSNEKLGDRDQEDPPGHVVTQCMLLRLN